MILVIPVDLKGGCKKFHKLMIFITFTNELSKTVEMFTEKATTAA